MLFASIDIGSNAVRLLFANVFEGQGRIRTDKATLIRIPIRLGLDVFESGRVSESRVTRLVDTMKAFKLLIEVYGPIDYVACATSAMREASNHDEIIQQIQDATGLEIKVIDGMEEAGIISSFNRMAGIGDGFNTMYVDVGGGSTEISLMAGERFVASESFRIGTIRLLQERVEEAEWDRMKNWLRKHTRNLGNLRCIGSGGNINKLTKIFGSYEHNSLGLVQLAEAEKKLAHLSIDERIIQMGLRPDRADVILPAARIFRKIMKWAGVDEVVAPKVGLADGLVLMLYEDYRRKTNP